VTSRDLQVIRLGGDDDVSSAERCHAVTEVDKGLADFNFRASRQHQKTSTPGVSRHPRQRGTLDENFGKILIRHCDTDRIIGSMTFEEILAMPVPRIPELP